MANGGARAGAGRKKGVPNRNTTALKDAIMNAFVEVGGQSYLKKVALEDPKTFCTLLSKILPAELKLEGELDLGIVINVVDYTNHTKRLESTRLSTAPVEPTRARL